jgi:hypothetical protein
MSSKMHKPSVPMFVEPLESRQLLSVGLVSSATVAPLASTVTVQPRVHRVSSATRLTFVATPATTLMGQPFTLSAKLTSGGLPLRTATIKITDSSGNLVANIVTARSGYASLTIPNAFVGNYQLKAAFAGASRYLASASPLIPIHINQPTFVTAANGLRTATVITSTGTVATTGRKASVKYTGFLTNGTRFDTNVGSAGTFDLVIGQHNAIAGFEQGVTGMNVGETRDLVIPPALGYGSTPNGNIPANSTLIFIVTLVAVA